MNTSVVLDHGALYSPPRSPVIVHVPPITYLMVDGAHSPGASLVWAEAVDALRCAERAALADRPDAEPAPLEVLWHDDDARWTLMLAVPVGDGGEPAPSDHDAVRTGRLHERWAAQLMRSGTDREREIALRRLSRFIQAQGYRAVGPVHEILLDGLDPDDAPRRSVLRRTVREL